MAKSPPVDPQLPHPGAQRVRVDRQPPRGAVRPLHAALDHPEDAAARTGRGRELIEREYSVERYREKIARAYAAVERLAAR